MWEQRGDFEEFPSPRHPPPPLGKLYESDSDSDFSHEQRTGGLGAATTVQSRSPTAPTGTYKASQVAYLAVQLILLALSQLWSALLGLYSVLALLFHSFTTSTTSSSTATTTTTNNMTIQVSSSTRKEVKEERIILAQPGEIHSSSPPPPLPPLSQCPIEEQEHSSDSDSIANSSDVDNEDLNCFSTGGSDDGGYEGDRRESKGPQHFVESNGLGKVFRRDSDTSDYISSDGGGSPDEEVHPEVTKKIIDQVQSMFSDEHLAKDGFLLKHVRRRSDGFVSLKLVAGLRKVKQISREFNVILNALQSSAAETVEVNPEGTKVRRIAPLTPYLRTLPTSSQNKENSTSGKANQGENERNARRRGGSLPMVHQNGYMNGPMNVSPTSVGNGHFFGGARPKSNSYSAGHPLNNFYSPPTGGNNWGGVGGRKNSSPNVGSYSNRNSFSGPSTTQQQKCPKVQTDENNANSVRRRGGSLPIARPISGHYGGPGSPPSSNLQTIPQRPKSNSYCEGSPGSSSGTSVWLAKRMAAGRCSDGALSFTSGGTVLRQPRGPDGTKGFSAGYRELILKEKSTLGSSSSVGA